MAHKGGQTEIPQKIKEIWAKRDKALKDGSFSDQVMAGKVLDLEYLKTQRPKIALKVTKAFSGDDIYKILMKQTRDAEDASLKI